MAAVDDDVFGVFGSDNSDDDDQHQEDLESSSNNIKNNHNPRSNSNGVGAFHEGTEQALLVHVRQQLIRKHHTDVPSLESSGAAATTARRLLECVDDFCWRRHWMMHVGHDKGVLLEAFLQERLQQRQHSGNHEDTNFVVVELGTYCGYSLIRTAATILEFREKEWKFTVYSVDVDPQTQRVARQMVQLVPGLSERVAFVLLPPLHHHDTNNDYNDCSSLSKQLLRAMQERGLTNDDDTASPPPQIDFLFIDHAKELYLPDLRQLEESGMVRRGTAVAADNVVYFQLDRYRQHMRELHKEGIVTTRLHDQGVYLEYSHRPDDDDGVPAKDLPHASIDRNRTEPPEPATAVELRDGLEFTVYLKDPPI